MVINEKYHLAVFDVDGTLLDTSEGLVFAFRHALEKNDLPVPPEKVLRNAIGPPFYQFLKEHYSISETAAKAINDDFRSVYAKDDVLFMARPYEGIYDALEMLSSCGIGIAVATNKREDYALNILKHFHFDDYTEIMFGTDFDNKLKKADVIKKALCSADMTPDKAVMIGDSSSDVNGAAALQMDFIGVEYGFGFHKSEDVFKFANAVFSAKTPYEAAQFLARKT